MITRYALFDGTIHPGQTTAFRNAVRAEMLPVWMTFPGATAVRVTFADSRDDGAPEYPLILAINYSDQAAVDAFLWPIPSDWKAAKPPKACWPVSSPAASTTM